MKSPAILLLSAAALLAQSNAPTPPPTSTVSGRIIDADSGAPIPDVGVGILGRASASVDVRTDAQGYYRFTDVTPGPQQVIALVPSANSTRVIDVEPGIAVTSVDFRVRLAGEISGRIYDEDKDPVVALQVHVVMREYEGGSVHYFTNGMRATTNDRGEYIVHNVPAGRALFVMFEPLKVYPNPVSEAPADPKWRKPAYRPTYYPNAESGQTATMVTLRSGERRERVDIQVMRSPSYCIDATLFEEGRPASLDFKVTDALTWGPNSATSGGKSGPGGKIRVCDLYPGQFQITALRQGGQQVFGSALVIVDHEDVHNVRVFATGPSTVQAEVGWDGPPPANADAAQFAFFLSSGVTGGLVWPGGSFSVNQSGC
jgi:hypothetical protein